jgi:myo-inositol-hexaphosphate 3-phosphohydrolase
MAKKRSRGRPLRRPKNKLQEQWERAQQRGLGMWLLAGGTALIAGGVLLVALLAPRSAGSPQFGGAAESVTPSPDTTRPSVQGEVTATAETEPVPHSGDAADDVAIWLHPTEPSRSTVLGTDKVEGGGLGVYDLDGNELYFYNSGNLNNVDLRYNFPLGDMPVALVAVTNRTAPVSVQFFRVNESDRSLTGVGEILLREVGIDRARGLTMYHSPVSGKYYVFVTNFSTNEVHQFELSGATGTVTGTPVRSFDNGDTTEGMVTDDLLQRLYVSEEDVGVWQYGAEPETGSTRTLVDDVVPNGGHITPNVKNLAVYYRSDGSGYLIVSSQGGSNFVVYERSTLAYLGAFEVSAGDGVDGVNGQDGIEVTNLPLGDSFPQGMFVTQDHVNSNSGNGNSGNQNFKYVPWERIANTLVPPLEIDTSFDPRAIGATPGQ